MKYIKQFAIILFIYYIGIILNKLLIPVIPATVLGMLILFVLLNFGLVKINSIKEFSEFLLMNLAFFFIPPGITLIKSWDVLSSNLWKILFIVLITTFITMIVTGKTVDFLIKKGDNNGKISK